MITKCKYLFRPKASVVVYHQTRRCVSALYMTGDKAKDNYSVLHPFMDFSDVFDNGEEMQKNIESRQMNLNFSEIKKKYQKFIEIKDKKVQLDNRRIEISAQLKAVPQSTDKNKDHIQNLKDQGKVVREELRTLKENLYPIEEDFIQDFLNLPNKLHIQCPTGENIQLLYRQGLPSQKERSEFHVNRSDLIHFKNSSCFYLLDEAATFELDLTHNCTEYFVNKNFTQTTNPDFARKIILEGIGIIDDSPFQKIQEDDITSKINSLHLNGGGSFSSFVGFIAKLTIYPSVLPMKLIASGRQYYANESEQKGLFTATQSNVVQAFIATETEEDTDREFEIMLNLIVDIYKKLGVHFQIVYEAANKISPAESLRASVQMYSPYFQEYIEVGHLSNYSNYISKRILFNFKDGKKYQFPNIIGGTVLDVTKVLGILIESNGNLKCPTYVEPKSSAIENFKDIFG